MKFSFSLLTILSLLVNDAAAFTPLPASSRRLGVTTKSMTDEKKPKEGMSMPDITMPDISMPDISMPDLSGITDSLASYDIGTVLSNLSTGGEVGTRGEAYAAAQAALVLCIVIGGVPVIGDTLSAVLGPGLLLGGVALTALSLVDLGSDSLSPFPAPPPTATLQTSGLYAQMRHPMYSGLVTIMLGLSLWTNSADRLVLTALLLYLVQVKCEKEEDFLMQQFPDDYAKYQVRTIILLA
jgi:protein-S-isoprenylcysteine O-methyltransferase Ste14